MSTPFVEFRHVCFSYGERHILSDVNFSVAQGEFIAVMGASGSGKTTLLRLLTGQLQPRSGEILINGQNLAYFSEHEQFKYRRRLGVLFQFGALFTDLSVQDNVAFPLREHTNLPENLIRRLVALKLNAVGLYGSEHLMPAELSGGMARRVALARTIALDPQLMLYDEPFTGLDPISLGVTAHLIARLNHTLKATGIMVTHDIGTSLELVDRVIFLAEGKMIFSGTPEEVHQTDLPWVRQFVDGKPEGPVDYRYPTSHTLVQDFISGEV